MSELPHFPLAQYLGLHVERPATGHAVARLTPGKVHLNPHGVVHGAVLFALVDTAMGAATYTVMPEGAICASIEVQLRFLTPAVAGAELVTDVHVVKAGSRVVQLEARISANDELVATAAGSFAVFIPR